MWDHAHRPMSPTRRLKSVCDVHAVTSIGSTPVSPVPYKYYQYMFCVIIPGFVYIVATSVDKYDNFPLIRSSPSHFEGVITSSLAASFAQKAFAHKVCKPGQHSGASKDGYRIFALRWARISLI